MFKRILRVSAILACLASFGIGHSAQAATLCDGKAATMRVTGAVTQGTPGNDVIIGTDAGETIYGNGGNDTICGMGGNDTINGNQGNDVVNGNIGLDTVNGGQGDDRLYGGQDDDKLYGDKGNDKLYGDKGGSDYCYGGFGETDTIDATCEKTVQLCLVPVLGPINCVLD